MELLILAVACALIGLGSLAGTAWVVLGGEDIGVERIFLLLVGLLLAAVFLGLAGWVARQGPLRNLAKKSPAQPEEAKEAISKGAS